MEEKKFTGKNYDFCWYSAVDHILEALLIMVNYLINF